jgi:hypothetical protein
MAANPMLAGEQSQETANDGTKWEDCDAPTGERLSSMWLCAGSWEMITWPLEYQHRWVQYTARTKRRLETEVCGGRRRPSAPGRFPTFPDGRQWCRCAISASPLAGALLPPASQKSEQTSEESIYLMRLLKISHVQIRKVPPRSDSCRCSRATANVPVGCLPLGDLQPAFPVRR